MRLLLTDRALDPARDAPEFADYEWTGTTEVGVESPDRAPQPPRVVVSFSTTALPGMRRAYRHVIEALRTLPVEGVVTTGGIRLAGLRSVPPNVQIHGFVPHAQVLPGAALLVTHGGHSTTMKALAHGIPMLVLPLNPTADQLLIGDVLEREGLGRRRSARSSAERLRQEIAALLDDELVSERARRTGSRLRAERPGADVAATRILEVADASRG